MNKKVPVVTVAEVNEPAELPDEVTVALADLAGAMREGLLAFASATGLAVLQKMMEAELTARIGPKHAKIGPDRSGNWHGNTQGSLVFGGRLLTVERPRGRPTEGEEIALETWNAFTGRDLLNSLVVERMLAGVATRRHVDVAEPVGAEIEKRSRATSKSAVSRRFVAAMEKALAELMARSLAEIDVAVLMVDGIEVEGQCCVAALVITADGTKIPVGLWLGDTENKTVVTALLADLVERGLDCSAGVLCVIDGAKALAAGIKKVFGDKAVIQRCTIHKRRNVKGHLNKELGETIDRRRHT
jgi:putative transposase